MQTSGTNRRLRILLTSIRDGTLEPRPEFQRRLVWTNKHKQDFVKTVLLKYPFPEIYIAAGSVDHDTGEGTEMLVDGQQRLTTLLQYFSGSANLRLGTVRPYAELTPEEKLAFLEYEVVVRDLGQKSIEEIKEVFTRINSTKYSLNAMEIHNARYDGEFKKYGESLSEHEFFEMHRVFKTNDIRRMGDLVFCLTVAITLLSAYFNREDSIEDFLAKYNDDFSDAADLDSRIKHIFSTIEGWEIDDSCRAWKKADLLNLIVETDRFLARNPHTADIASAGDKLRKFYDSVDLAAAGQESTDEAHIYYRAVIQGVNDRMNRLRRGEIIGKILCC